MITQERSVRDTDLHQFWLRTYPMLEMYRAMCISGPAMADARRRAAWNRLACLPDVIKAGAAAIVSVNNDTLYGRCWVDLRAGPVVLRVPPVPDGRYWSLQFVDTRSENVAMLGPGCGRDAPGEYLLCAAACDIAQDDARPRVVLGSDIGFVILRVVLYGEHDLPAARAVQAGFGLAAPEGAPRPAPLALPAAHTAAVADWAEDHARAVAQFMIAHLPYCDERHWLEGMAATLRDAAIDQVRAAWQDTCASVLEWANRMGTHVQGWSYLPAHIGTWGDDVALRAAVARKALYALSPAEAVYAIANTDAQGQPLDGAVGVQLSMSRAALPEVRFFWSLTVYDAQGRLYPNTLDRYALGDRSPGLVRGAEGTLVLHVSHTRPPEVPQANWIPAPIGPMYLILRGYGPTRHWGAGAYLLPAVRRNAPGRID